MEPWRQRLVDLANDGVNRLTEDDATEILEEITKLRTALEWQADQMWESWGIDGGDWQDTMEKMGIIVPVKPDEAFITEHGDDMGPMYVLAWSERARGG